jgi:hypothetical protein
VELSSLLFLQYYITQRRRMPGRLKSWKCGIILSFITQRRMPSSLYVIDSSAEQISNQFTYFISMKEKKPVRRVRRSRRDFFLCHHGLMSRQAVGKGKSCSWLRAHISHTNYSLTWSDRANNLYGDKDSSVDRGKKPLPHCVLSPIAHVYIPMLQFMFNRFRCRLPAVQTGQVPRGLSKRRSVEKAC